MTDDQGMIYRALLAAQDAGQPVALVTIIRVSGSVPRHAGSKLLVYGDGHFVGTVGGGALEARTIAAALDSLKDGQTRLVSHTLNDLADGDPGICGGTVEIFIEPQSIRPTLLIIGCGHIGQALASLGLWADYRVIVSDDRADLCNSIVIPNAHDYLICAPADVPRTVAIDAQTYIAAVTRGLPIDVDLIPALLDTPAAYIGVIGSRRRWALTAQALIARGISADRLARLHVPIGLELQAETPKEIALSILAEITMIRHGGTGQPMRDSDVPLSTHI